MGKTENFSGADIGLLRYFKERLHQTMGEARGGDRRAYATDAELVWSSKHYLMVRTGPDDGKRTIMLFSREAALLRRGNRDKNAMLEVALATINPVFKTWNANIRRTLWISGKYGGGLEELRYLRGRRYSKSLLQELIVYAESFEASLDQRLNDYIVGETKIKEFVRGIPKTLLEGGLNIGGIDRGRSSYKVNPKRMRADQVYHVDLPGEKSSKTRFKFKISRTGTIKMMWPEFNMTPEEFEVMQKAVVEIARMRADRLAKEETTERKVVTKVTATKGLMKAVAV